MQIKKLDVADAGLPLAMETVPSLCNRPVCSVVSNGMAAKSFNESTLPPCITSILMESFGWLLRVTALKKELLSYKCASTYLKKLATVMGALEGNNSMVILPRAVFTRQVVIF